MNRGAAQKQPHWKDLNKEKKAFMWKWEKKSFKKQQKKKKKKKKTRGPAKMQAWYA